MNRAFAPARKRRHEADDDEGGTAMKKNRICALIALLALLLSVPVLAAAGDASDPLISRSYAQYEFRDEVDAALDAISDLTVRSAAAQFKAADGWTVRSLAAGESVTLGDGQQLVLLDGGVRLTVVSGKLINCTLGRASDGGDARTGHRYVAWDGASVRADCAERAVVACSANAAAGGQTAAPQPTDAPQPSEPPQPADCPFTDVPAGAWYFADVVNAVRRGLVNGMTPTTYAPQGNLTLAQTVKLAACMHQKAAEGAVTLANAADGLPWYDSYVRYALAHGILDAEPAGGWNDPVTRADFVRIFYRALPETAYAPVNDVPDGTIPDDSADAPAPREVYAFYRAGILTGYAEGDGRAAHAFGADTNISRAEVAAIMNRMFDETARVRFAMG